MLDKRKHAHVMNAKLSECCVWKHSAFRPRDNSMQELFVPRSGLSRVRTILACPVQDITGCKNYFCAQVSVVKGPYNPCLSRP